MSILTHKIGLYSSASGGAIDTYAVGGNSPDVVADFASATEYFRVGGTASDFETMFDLGTTTAYPTSLRTMVDSDGLVKWGPHNLFAGSTALDTSTTPWTSDGGGKDSRLVVSTNYGTAPDGTTTSAALLDNNIGGTNSVRAWKNNFVLKSGEEVTVGVYLKAGVDSFGFIETISYDTGANGESYFNLSTGAVSSEAASHTASIVSVGSGWYLCSVSFTTVTDVSGFIGWGCSTASGSRNVTLDGSVHGEFWGPHAYYTSLGGMVDVPTDQRAASGSAFATYVPTTTAARYLHRRGNHTWNGSAWVKSGILVETEARTNLLLNSGTLSTQNVTTSATPYTLSFTGTGTVTLSGTSTAGPLVGTGTGENNRVNLTFTPTAGTLTLTVSGTVTNAQLEAGSTPSSYIPTSGATVTRSADALTIPAANMSASTSAMSLQLDGTITYADEGAAAQQTFLRWQTDANNYISLDLDTDSTDTGQVNANQGVGGTVDTVVASAQYSPGIDVAFNIASRHTSGAINVAKDGVAATADTTPASLVDLSARNCELSQDAMVNISQFRQWDVDLGDSGIATAST